MTAAERNAGDGPRLADVASAVFARHKTYPPRHGWLSKGFYAANSDPGIFGRDDAPVVLGVGSSMVPSIRYWMSAFKLSEERGLGRTVPTWEAQWLLTEDGADPYLEDPASLWLLHWNLLSPPCSAPTWWITFNTLGSRRFQADDLAKHVADQAHKAGWDPPSRDSVERDISCFTRMYGFRAPAGRTAADLEDLINCPFRSLGLLDETEASWGSSVRQWRIVEQRWGRIPAAVVAYACLDYASRHSMNEPGSVSLARLAHEPGAPGRAFPLNRETLTAALEETAARYPALAVTESGAGQAILAFSSAPRELAWDILDAHYDGARARVATRKEWTARFPRLGQVSRRTPASRYRAGSAPGHATLFEWGSAPRRSR
jgi:Protein of unknown function (DUF4007)